MSILGRFRLRWFFAGCFVFIEQPNQFRAPLSHRSRRSMSRNAASSSSLSTAHLLDFRCHGAVTAFMSAAA